MSEEIVRMLKAGMADSDWFSDNLSRIKSEYNNKFVAFMNKRVIDSGSDLKKLLSRIRKRKIDTSLLQVEFISKVKRILCA